jgi:hypothetical protein
MLNSSGGIWEELYKDPPFNVHIVRKSEDAHHIVGKVAGIYFKQFIKKYEASIASCIITTIAGEPGSGKSYFLAHLKYRMKIGDIPGIPIIIRLNGREDNPKSIYCKIREDEEYIKACYEAGITIKDVADVTLADTIRDEIRAIKSKKPLVSICLLVDNVDEFVRSNAFRLMETNKYSKEYAMQESLKSLLTLFNKMIDSIRMGVCVVLSLTTDVVKSCSLERMGDEGTFISVVGKDSSLRRRFQPIYKSGDSNEILLFSSITLDDAIEMVAYNMEGWFKRQNTFERKKIEECSRNGFNTYPFSIESIRLLHEVSVYPGEIILGCLSSIQRYHELLKRPDYDEQNIQSEIITETYAALGILQMRDYFYVRLEQLKGDFNKRLVEIINKDLNVLYKYTLPQIVEKIMLDEVKVLKNLGLPFLIFLNRLMKEKEKDEGISIIQSSRMFLRTRGKIQYPNLPTIDCIFKYCGKRFGVQFLLEDSPRFTDSKLLTSCKAIQAPGADRVKEDDILDTVIYICFVKNKNENNFIKKIQDFINQPKDNFIIHQNKDYRPCVGLVEVDEEDGWKWKALNKPDLFDENQKIKLAIMMEHIDYFTWVSHNGEVKEKKFDGNWIDLIKTLCNAEPYSPSNHIIGLKLPDKGGWER